MWWRAWQWLRPIPIAPDGNEGAPVRRPSSGDQGPGVLSVLDYDSEDATALHLREYEVYLRRDIAAALTPHGTAYVGAAQCLQKQEEPAVSSLVFLALRAVYGALRVYGRLPADDENAQSVEDELAQSALSTIPPGVYYAASGTEFIEVGETGGRVLLRKGACVRTYYGAGRLCVETWHVGGRNHRADGPSHRMWDDVGHLFVEGWHIDGNEHRADGPSYRIWDQAGRLRVERWRVDGKSHRVDGPSFRRWDETGRLREERWRVDGVPVDPPACLA